MYVCTFTVYKYVVIINRAGVSKASLNIELHAGLKKMFCWARNFSFSLAQWASAWASCLSTKQGRLAQGSKI